MLENNITATTSLTEYRATIMEPTATTRSVSGLDLGVNQDSRVAHTITKAGIVNSAVMVRQTNIPVGVDCSIEDAREFNVLIKLSYPDNATAAEIASLKVMYQDALEHIDGTDLDLFLNKEH